MQLVNEFVVPRGVDETWAVLTDIGRIAPAMPGAEITGIEDGRYSGKVKVKVGPVTAAYAGVASFRERDDVNHHMVLDATGRESNGRGRAAAVVTADLVPEGEQTRVKVSTDLTISGPLAQFGRGAIAEVSARLLNQFVVNLKETVLNDVPETAAAPAPDSGPDSAPNPVAAGSGGSAETTPVPMWTPTAAVPTAAVPTAAVRTTDVDPSAAAEINVLRVAAWPILKRVIPLVVLVAAIVVLIVWLA